MPIICIAQVSESEVAEDECDSYVRHIAQVYMYMNKEKN